MTQPLDLSEQDLADLKQLADEQGEEGIPVPDAPRLTLLEVWQAILSNIAKARLNRVDPAVASKILRAWPFLKMQELVRYTALYYDYLEELQAILLFEIASDSEALKHTEDDAIENKAHYLNLLLVWQLQVQHWGLDWDSTDPESHISLAALADAQNFVLGSTGLIAHLDAINFEFTEGESAEIENLLAIALEEA